MMEFNLSEQIKFEMMVGIDSSDRSKNLRFGIDLDQLNAFVKDLLEVEIEGRKFRTEYQITMESGAPQAENYMWTILGNKVIT